MDTVRVVEMRQNKDREHAFRFRRIGKRSSRRGVDPAEAGSDVLVLLGLLQMHQRGLGVLRRNVGLALLAGIDRLLQMIDSLLGMRVGLGFLGGLGVSEPDFGMNDELFCITFLAFVDCLLRMGYGFLYMVFDGKRNPGARNSARARPSMTAAKRRVMASTPVALFIPAERGAGDLPRKRCVTSAQANMRLGR